MEERSLAFTHETGGAYLGGAVDSEPGDAGGCGGAYEGRGGRRDAGVLQVAVRVEEPHGGGGATRSLSHGDEGRTSVAGASAGRLERWLLCASTDGHGPGREA